jgi:hypothetical protein
VDQRPHRPVRPGGAEIELVKKPAQMILVVEVVSICATLVPRFGRSEDAWPDSTMGRTAYWKCAGVLDKLRKVGNYMRKGWRSTNPRQLLPPQTGP